MDLATGTKYIQIIAFQAQFSLETSATYIKLNDAPPDTLILGVHPIDSCAAAISCTNLVRFKATIAGDSFVILKRDDGHRCFRNQQPCSK
jgi:hypothetical protein